jgi:phosphopantothenoylcysteine decarboxylase/phosphopantothenate--cysteine ligase
MLKGKRIILGVTGGIAAYKTPWLVREFVKSGAEVQVVMTPSASHFVTPLTLSTVSQRQVIIETFPAPASQGTDQWTKHIDLAVWADVMLIAPATANTIAKMAHGLADNFLTTLVLALRCPLVIAPSMDVDMYLNEVTAQNIDALKQSGCFILPPDSGELASGLTGPGRLPELSSVIDAVDRVLDRAHRDLQGKKVLVSAGPTQEPIDPVRYIGNRSSGKMGFAVANAAALRGAEVTLVSGPVQLRTPRNTRRIDVATAREMHDAMQKEFPRHDLVIMSAAVADFSPADPATEKIKRHRQHGETLTLDLKENPDILKSLSEHRTHQVLVGFALETTDALSNARQKLSSKHLDAIVLNNPREEGAAFGIDTNVVTVITADGKIEKLPKLSKFDVANEILDRIVPLLREPSRD